MYSPHEIYQPITDGEMRFQQTNEMMVFKWLSCVFSVVYTFVIAAALSYHGDGGSF